VVPAPVSFPVLAFTRAQVHRAEDPAVGHPRDSGPRRAGGVHRGKLVGACQDLIASPGILLRERAVQLQMAGAVNLPLPLERVVAERAVEGGQGQVAERVHEDLLDLIRILAQAGEMLAPLLAQRLRQDVLDRQAGLLKVDELRG
jgi:hypothetical protein